MEFIINQFTILTVSNWYAWEQRTVNAIANFGEDGIDSIWMPSMEWQRSLVIAERPWSDAMDWSTLAHKVVEFNALKSKY